MRAPHISFIISLGCQLSGFALGYYLRTPNSASLHLLIHATTAFILSHLFRLSITWQIVNLILPFGIAFFTNNQIPSIFWYIIGILLILYTPTFITRVPFYPSNLKVYQAVLSNLPTDRKINLLDAGCGSAAMLCYLAKRRPESSFTGVEINPLVFLIAKIHSLFYTNVTVHFKSFWKMDLTPFNVLYTFLAPPFMPGIWEKAKKELRPNSLLLSNSFPVPAEADAIQELGEGRQNALYIYKI